MIFYISDTHFGHANIIAHCGRPFETVGEMDAVLLANWNAAVGEGDTVYVLGDLLFRVKGDPAAYLERLQGRKHLIVGNHDRSWMKKCDPGRFFESVSLMENVRDGTRAMTLCHYPMMSWPDCTRTYMIFGHIHNNTHGDYWPLIERSPLMLNAGVEINGYRPVSFEELVENNRKFKEQAAASRA